MNVTTEPKRGPGRPPKVAADNPIYLVARNFIMAGQLYEVGETAAIPRDRVDEFRARSIIKGPALAGHLPRDLRVAAQSPTQQRRRIVQELPDAEPDASDYTEGPTPSPTASDAGIGDAFLHGEGRSSNDVIRPTPRRGRRK